MSVFLERNHLFLRNPRGGVEGVEEMSEAGFNAIFCNVKDFDPAEWQIVRERAKSYGVICGPWSRTSSGEAGAEFDPNLLLHLLDIAEDWDSPYIVNSESELNGSGSDLTEYIARMCDGDEWALSTEPWPYANVDWTPITAPVLPQCFGPDWGHKTDEVRAEWQRYGVRCVVPTYGTYSGWTPDLYDRLAPYGLYTADDCGGNYAAWIPLGAIFPCAPENGEDMAQIGPNHGVTASMNRLRTLDPAGTLLIADSKTGKWPPLSNLDEVPLDQHKAWDKLERTLGILVEDHDGGI